MIVHPKFAGIPVSDQNRTLQFFTDKLGFEVITDAPYGDDGRWVEVLAPGAETRVVLFRSDDAKDRQGTMGDLWFQTDDLDATYAELTAKGVDFTVEPQPAPWNPNERWAQFADPDGILYGLS